MLWLAFLACGDHEPAPATPGGAAPTCGDGVLDDFETCDDGGTADGDGCRSDCTRPACLDGREDPPQSDGVFDWPGDGLCWTFTAQHALPSMLMARVLAADVDADGDADLAAVDDLGAVHTLVSDGHGELREGPAPAGPHQAPSDAAAADLDGDGVEEILVAHGASVATWRSDGAAWALDPFEPEASGTTRLATGDLDGDGDADAALLLLDPAATRLLAFPNDGGALGSAVVALGPAELGACWGGAVAVADLDDDGAEELVVGCDGGLAAWALDGAAPVLLASAPASGRVMALVAADLVASRPGAELVVSTDVDASILGSLTDPPLAAEPTAVRNGLAVGGAPPQALVWPEGLLWRDDGAFARAPIDSDVPPPPAGVLPTAALADLDGDGHLDTVAGFPPITVLLATP